MTSFIREWIGWVRWKLRQWETIRKAREDDPYIYPPD